MPQQNYSKHQLARLLGVSTRILTRWADSGRLPLDDAGSISHESLEAFLAAYAFPDIATLEQRKKERK